MITVTMGTEVEMNHVTDSYHKSGDEPQYRWLSRER